MINYKEIWRSLNKESAANFLGMQIARRILSKKLVVFLASDYKRDVRLLYIKVDSENVVIENLPRFRGLEITLVSESLGEFENEFFLKFTQSIPNTDNIFELVISDICDRIVSFNNDNINSTLINVLSEWKYFFEKLETKILSPSEQKGLFGELYFLKNYLLKKYTTYESLVFWTGADKTNHDFQINKNAVEIKTSSSKQHKKITIASERQLDNTGLDNLFLGVMTFNMHINCPSKALGQIVSDIFVIINDDFAAVYFFEIKLIKIGFNRLNSDKYTVGFSTREVKFYEVVDGFPRLLYKQLPNGIGDIKYTVMVATCEPFEIKTDILQLI